MSKDIMKLLQRIRRSYYNNKKKFKIKYITLAVLLSVGCVLIDLFVPWGNTLYNYLRCVPLVPLSIILFMISYTMLPNVVDNKVKANFTYHQRVNISILVFAILIGLHLFLLKPGFVLYTLSTSILMTVLMHTTLFTIPLKDEKERLELGIEKEK